MGGVARGRARDRHHRNRVRQDARVQPAGPRCARYRPEEPRDLPLSDEGARAGPGPLPRGARGPEGQAGDLRRRHAARAAVAGAQMGEPHSHEPGHAPRRRPAAPRPLGGRPPQPPLRRRGRGARVPRRLRLARRQCASAVAPHGACVRRGAAIRARIRDDREPGRARRETPRSRGHRRRRRCGAARGADGRAVACARLRSAKRRDSPQRSCSADCGRSASRRAARQPSSCIA